jgi:hypothetical protein
MQMYVFKPNLTSPTSPYFVAVGYQVRALWISGCASLVVSTIMGTFRR